MIHCNTLIQLKTANPNSPWAYVLEVFLHIRIGEPVEGWAYFQEGFFLGEGGWGCGGAGANYWEKNGKNTYI